MTLALATVLASASPASTSDTARGLRDATTPTTVTIVRVRTPWYAPQWLVTRRMRGTLPQYRAIDGLLFKAYAHARDRRFGGVYFWRDNASAAAWFNDAWFARVRAQYGEAGSVRRFTVVQGTAQWPVATDAHASAVAVLEVVADDASLSPPARAEAAADNDAPIARYLLTDERGARARLTLWKSAAQAKRHTSAIARDGNSATPEWFDCPILLPVAQITGQ